MTGARILTGFIFAGLCAAEITDAQERPTVLLRMRAGVSAMLPMRTLAAAPVGAGGALSAIGAAVGTTLVARQTGSRRSVPGALARLAGR